MLTQLSYTIQYPHALWLPINNVLDVVRETGVPPLNSPLRWVNGMEEGPASGVLTSI